MVFSSPSTQIIVLLTSLMLVSSSPAWAQQHYTNCLSNNANDATVIIPSDAAVTLGSGDSLSTGDEIALYSNDGRCAGIGVWDSSKTALSIAVADRDNTAGVTEGYETAEELKYRIWRKSDGQEFQVASVAYSCSLPGCKSDGLYERDALFEVETLDASSALPVELASFEATHRGRAVELRWRTVSETNNSGFKVQHKARSQGSWSTLTFVEGAGTTSRPQAYQYEAANLEYGTHQFRLVQIDQDGSRNETKPVGVELKLDRAYEISKVSPNPVRQSGTVNLTVQKTQHVTVRLYDLLGRKQGVLFDRSLSSDQTTQIQVRTDLLPNGRYFLQVDGEDFQTTRRFTVVK